MNKYQKLKDRNLNKIQRRALWILGNGELSPQTGQSLAKISGYVGRDGTSGHMVQKAVSTLKITQGVYGLQNRVPEKSKSITYHNLVRLEKYGLVSGYHSSTQIYSDRQLWKLNDWGFRVVAEYQEEIKSGETLNWDPRRLNC